MENEKRKKQVILNSRIMSSAHINFLFGAGVNGNAIKKMNDMKETVALLEKYLKRKMANFEDDLSLLTENNKDKVLHKFKKELTTSIKSLDLSHPDIKAIGQMFASINNLINKSENRTKTMKQVNIYTTNYDDVLEKVINKNGYLCNVISSSNYDNNDKFFELIGFDYGKEIYVPTYLISKIHGDIDNPILPCKNKYDETLQKKRFEILFRMKSQLSRKNSILFVIGYSGHDEHINSLVNDAINFGLTVYWFKYNNEESIPDVFVDSVEIIEQLDNVNKINPTLICERMVNNLWEKQLDE